MSAKLEKALAQKQVLIRKVISGEVVIRFSNQEIKDIVLSHNGIMDLLSKRGITTELIRNSNLKELLQNKFVEVL